jgi:glycerol-3-phosphate dehydrogenase (NAD(P)+)
MSIVTVIGEGAWGTAMATVLAENNHTVLLWCHDPEVKKAIETTRYNERYLPGILLHDLIVPVTNLNEAVAKSSWIFESTPVKFLRSVLMTLDKTLIVHKPWVILSKGIEKNTLLFPTQIIDELFGEHCQKLVLFGPSFARELAEKKLTAVTIASDNTDYTYALKEMVDTDYFVTYLSQDPRGVQLCGAVKNSVALMMGMLSGAGYGDNTKAFVATRCFNEMALLVKAVGGNPETVLDLAGFGDLILTSFGSLSRNVKMGELLSQGNSLDDILKTTGMIPESINTVESVYQLIIQKKLELPIFRGMYDLVFNNLSLNNFLRKMIK